jgi:hypothetical protein
MALALDEIITRIPFDILPFHYHHILSPFGSRVPSFRICSGGPHANRYRTVASICEAPQRPACEPWCWGNGKPRCDSQILISILISRKEYPPNLVLETAVGRVSFFLDSCSYCYLFHIQWQVNDKGHNAQRQHQLNASPCSLRPISRDKYGNIISLTS